MGGINSSDSTKSETEMFIYSTDANGSGSDKTEAIDVGGSCTGVSAWNIDSVVYECACCDHVASLCVSSVGVLG